MQSAITTGARRKMSAEFFTFFRPHIEGGRHGVIDFREFRAEAIASDARENHEPPRLGHPMGRRPTGIFKQLLDERPRHGAIGVKRGRLDRPPLADHRGQDIERVGHDFIDRGFDGNVGTAGGEAR